MSSGFRDAVHRSGRAVLLLVALSFGTTHNSAAEDFPPDVVVFCEPTLKPVVTKVAEMWEEQTGAPVRIIVSPTALLLEQVSHHIRSDILIAQGDEAANTAMQRELIKPGTRVDLWQNHLVVAARAPAKPVPNPLAGSEPIALVDAVAATAGVETRQALESAGLWDSVQKRATGTASTEDAAFLLTDGKADLAIVYATDVAADRHLVAIGSLADGSYPPIHYWMAETSALVSPAAGKFEAFLRQSQAQAILHQGGLEILP